MEARAATTFCTLRLRCLHLQICRADVPWVHWAEMQRHCRALHKMPLPAGRLLCFWVPRPHPPLRHSCREALHVDLPVMQHSVGCFSSHEATPSWVLSDTLHDCLKAHGVCIESAGGRPQGWHDTGLIHMVRLSLGWATGRYENCRP